jgi:hypothetical protein
LECWCSPAASCSCICILITIIITIINTLRRIYTGLDFSNCELHSKFILYINLILSSVYQVELKAIQNVYEPNLTKHRN